MWFMSDSMDILHRAFVLRVRATEIDAADIEHWLSPKAIAWSDEVFERVLIDRSLR